MIYQWLALPFFAGWWLASTGLIHRTNPAPSQWLLLGLLCLLVSRGKENTREGSVMSTLWVVPALAFAWALGIPWGTSGWVLAVALLTALLFRPFPRLTFVPAALATAGVVLAVQTVVIAGYGMFGVQLRAVPGAAELFAPVLREFGVMAGDANGQLIVTHTDASYALTPSWNSIGLLPLLLILFGTIPVLWLHSRKPLRAFLSCVLVLAAYAPVRYLFLIALYRWQGDNGLFYKTGSQVVSMLPAALLLSRFVRLGDPERSFLPALNHGASLAPVCRVFAASAAASLLLFLAATFHDPGEQKSGRVLFEEYHSDWEWTDEPMNTATYGLRTGYNYSCLYDYLGHYFDVGRNDQPITTEALEEWDVLVLRTPTLEYGPDEVAAIQEFVSEGGGLWLIGDHTNVFGSGEKLNEVAQEFGVRFVYDCAYDLDTGQLNMYYPPERTAHPSVSRMPPFLFATPCTVDADWPRQPTMVAKSLSVVPADYSQPNFFPRPGKRFEHEYGAFQLGVARYHDRGRVLAFTDSTVFSNFFMFIPGKPELALGNIDWLNRSNWLAGSGWWLSALGGVLVLLAFSAARGLDRGWATTLLVLGAGVGATCAGFVSDASARIAYPALSEHRAMRGIDFDLGHSSMFLPISRLQGDNDNDYSTFFTWTQRLGMVPAAHLEIEQAFDEANIVVVVDSRSEFTEEDLSGYADFVEQGGTLLVLDGSAFSTRTADALISQFGMSFGEQGEELEELVAPFDLVSVERPLSVHGGTALLATQSGRVVAAWKTHGQGRVVVTGVSELFTASRMGTVSVSPTEEQMQIFHLVFALVRFTESAATPPLASLIKQELARARQVDVDRLAPIGAPADGR